MKLTKKRYVTTAWIQFCLALAACWASQAFAQLSWDTRQLDFHPKPEESVVKGEFPFTNIGKAPITITDVKTSCGCTTAALTKKVYAPGEKGAIATTFTMGDRTGLQQKQVVVRTDYPEEMFIQLTVRVFIPEFLKLEPQIIRWPLNSKNEVRTFKLNAGTEQTIKVLGVRSTDDRIFAKLKTIEPGKKYEVEVSVNGTTEPLRGFVRVETDFPAQKPKAYNLPVEIGDPPRPMPPANAVTGAPTYPPGFPPGLVPPSAAPGTAAPPVAPPAVGTPPVATPAATIVTAPRPAIATPAAPLRAATPAKRTK
jgi:hypothetical protein